MKRYGKYKDSKVAWLGQIPEHWGELFLFQCADESKASNKGLVNQNLLSLSYGNIIRKRIDTTSGLLPASFETYQIVDSGNIIMRLTDLQNDKRSLRTGLVNEKGIITSAYVCLKCKSNVLPKYFHYLLHSFDISKLFYSLGGGLRQGCNYSDLKKVVITIPSLDEQEQIVRYLDWKVAMADKFVREKRREITLLKELRQAEINRAVTRGLDPTAPTKPSGIDWIGEIPKHWEVRNFNHHFIFGKGLPITKKDLIEEGIEVISYGQIHSKLNNTIGLNKELVRYVGPVYLETNPKSLLKKGDFVFADTSEDQEGSGNNIYIDTDNLIFAGYHTVIARPVNIDNCEYVAYLFQSECWKRQIKNAINGVKVFSITKAILRKTKILFPKPCEQQQIVEHIKTIEANINKAIEKIENEIALTAEYKTRLISDVTTGKVDVRGIEIPDYEKEEPTAIEEDNEDNNE